ncbi:MAG TPA: TolC family protein [Chitinophagaceae bacterium]|nr:TolC family protein [Chitinophagaceae bacterium]
MKRLFFSFLLVSLCGAGFAQPLRLQDAVTIALKNSLDIQVVRNNLQISDVNNNIGIAGGLPLVTATGSDNEQSVNINQKINRRTATGADSIYSIQSNGATSNQLASGVTGSITLYNGMRVVATKKRLAELEKQSQQYVNSQIQNIIASVMTSYYDIVRQQSYLKTFDQSIAVAEKKLDIIKAQQSVGLANNADLFQAQLDLNNLEQTKAQQQLVIDQAKTGLLTLLTLKPDSTVTISDTILVDKSIVLGTILDNLTSNPDIIAADAQIRINELIEKETAAQRYPTIRASAGYNYNRNQTSAGQTLLNQSNGPFVGGNFIIPIYNGSIYKRQQKIAAINTRNAGLQKDIAIRDYSSNAVKTYQAYASAKVQLETAQKNLELSQKLLDLVLQRFQLRQATIVDMTLAQQGFETAAFSLINLSYASKSSEIELKRLVSKLAP